MNSTREHNKKLRNGNRAYLNVPDADPSVPTLGTDIRWMLHGDYSCLLFVIKQALTKN